MYMSNFHEKWGKLSRKRYAQTLQINFPYLPDPVPVCGLGGLGLGSGIQMGGMPRGRSGAGAVRDPHRRRRRALDMHGAPTQVPTLSQPNATHLPASGEGFLQGRRNPNRY